MSLASLKNIHHVYLLIADIYGSGAGRVDAISSRGFFFQNSEEVTFVTPFTPILNS